LIENEGISIDFDVLSTNLSEVSTP